jgi:hypothetical protein
MVEVDQGGMAPKPKEKRVYRKRAKLIEASDRVVRNSTKIRTEVANETAAIVKKTRRKNGKRKVRVYTQAEILKEADKTERENISSLHAIKAWEEQEKKRRKPKGPVITGPRVIYHSKEGVDTITFRECDGLNVLPFFFQSLDGGTNR